MTRGVRTVVLQDTTEIGDRLDRWARAGDRSANGPEAILVDAWGPWRTESLRRALLWLRAHNATHPEDQVEIRGITRPTAVPADYDRVLALTAGTRDHERISALLATIRVAHDGGEHVERAHGRWTGKPFVDLARQAHTTTAAVLDPGSDAATRALGALDRIVRFHAAHSAEAAAATTKRRPQRTSSSNTCGPPAGEPSSGTGSVTSPPGGPASALDSARTSGRATAAC
ncbi:erythromycin esterase family protein [Micromonospora sp. LOL_015]|uniref:erythromycin esterase family protein n=1 Tax=Micromonospora sp. LOL_015 TaxID=3345416 RepID=UPI003A8C173B